jgi:hypothetical protein
MVIIHTADSEDLFWVLHSGGGNFGVVAGCKGSAARMKENSPMVHSQGLAIQADSELLRPARSRKEFRAIDSNPAQILIRIARA